MSDNITPSAASEGALQAVEPMAAPPSPISKPTGAHWPD